METGAGEAGEGVTPPDIGALGDSLFLLWAVGMNVLLGSFLKRDIHWTDQQTLEAEKQLQRVLEVWAVDVPEKWQPVVGLATVTSAAVLNTAAIAKREAIAEALREKEQERGGGEPTRPE